MKNKRRDTMKKTKKKRNKDHVNTRIFPLLLASLCSEAHNSGTLIKRCLNKVHTSLLNVQLPPILSLFPSLLKSNDAGIVCKCIEIIGAASLVSFEMNEQIAAEAEIVKSLISLLGCSEREIALASCNAVLDLSTTSVGRQRLLELSVIENFLLCFIQASESSDSTDSRADIMFPENDEYHMLLLQTAISLINSCTIEKLQQLIPSELSEKILMQLRRIIDKAHKQRICNSSSRCKQGDSLYSSKISMNNLAESIFRLSVNCNLHPGERDCHLVEKSIFGSGEVSIKQFISETWETYPMLIRDASNTSLKHDAMFAPFIQYLGPKEAILTSISSMLKAMVSCPAISSDELDILHVIEEIKDQLGHAITYHQDIRVVKTESGKNELHYFQKQSPQYVFDFHDISKCQEALKNGYSIALRGMEFRFQKIADIADELAYLFGQPSTGVNMYLTPPNSQGLARHSDDHCVFVCQLIGVKRWNVFPRSGFHLPRLYELNGNLNSLEDENCKVDECFEFLLEEGDILYIPRGIPHEAHTNVGYDGDVSNTGFSLHLTLAVEIEPPFEWEGFIQVALHIWNKKQTILGSTSDNPVTRNLYVIVVRLLHVAIKLLGNHNPNFRKACLVGATPSSSETKDWIFHNQRTTFEFLLSVIASESKFSEVTIHIEASLQKNKDPLDCLQWMRHLTIETDRSLFNLSFSWTDFNTLMHNRDIAEAVFLQLKSKFCNEVELDDVRKCYQVLLEKYRKVRKQYARGMLSLHHAVNQSWVF